MLAAGFFANRIRQQVIRLQAQLGRNETRHFLRNHLARLQQAPRTTKGAELKRETHLVFGAPSLPDVFDIVICQRVVLQQGCLVSRQIDKRGTLPLRQKIASWQFGGLRSL